MSDPMLFDCKPFIEGAAAFCDCALLDLEAELQAAWEAIARERQRRGLRPGQDLDDDSFKCDADHG